MNHWRHWLTGLTLMVAIGTIVTLGLAESLLLGWWQFLWRVGPQMTFDRGALLYGAAALLLLVIGVHLAVRWLYREMRPADDAAWNWRSSVALVAAVVTLFAAGIAVVGATHQGAWLMTREDHWYEWRAARVDPSDRNLKMIALGLLNYHDIHGRFPAGGTYSKSGTGMSGWGVAMLPGALLYAPGHRPDVPWNQPPNAEVLRPPLPLLINSNLPDRMLYSDDGYGVSHYAANQHVMGPNHSHSLAELSSPGQTLLVGEINANFQSWASPENCRDPLLGINTSPHGFGGPRGQGGAYFAMADGSVQFLADSIDPQLLRQMSAAEKTEKDKP